MRKVIHVITGLGDGGAEGALYRLVKKTIETSGVKVVIISLTDGGKYKRPLEDLGVKVICLELHRLKLFNFFKFFLEVKKFDGEVIVQTWMYHADLIGGFFAKVLGVKKIFWGIRHSTIDKKKTKKTTLAIVNLCRIMSYIIPNKIISCSNVGKNVHIEFGYNPSFSVIPNGYNYLDFKEIDGCRESFRKKNYLSCEKMLFAKIARWDPQKDHSNLLQAISLMKNKKDIYCILVGKGLSTQNTQLTNEIESLNLQNTVLLLGQSSEVNKLYQSVDAHVLSSSFGEAFPNVVAEAMLSGLPCIVTNVGDASEIVGKNGIVVPAKSPTALAEAMDHMFELWENDREKFLDLGQKSKVSVIERFSMEVMVNRFFSEWFETAK